MFAVIVKYKLEAATLVHTQCIVIKLLHHQRQLQRLKAVNYCAI